MTNGTPISLLNVNRTTSIAHGATNFVRSYPGNNIGNDKPSIDRTYVNYDTADDAKLYANSGAYVHGNSINDILLDNVHATVHAMESDVPLLFNAALVYIDDHVGGDAVCSPHLSDRGRNDADHLVKAFCDGRRYNASNFKRS